mmetsp:Transcript_30898/g.55990  ORF Transcript_30898/g.55990 Transcript_30898/m.55990 type:complete len:559 (-) Transcript_30898:68-1744(-)
MATALKPIECSAQPLSISFHPVKDILAAGLVDGTIEIHDLVAKGSGDAAASAKAKSNKTDDDDDSDDGMESDNDEDEDDQPDTILSSIHVAKEVVSPSKSSTQMFDKSDSTSTTTVKVTGKATQSPSCRCVLFSRSPNENKSNDSNNETKSNDHNANLLSGGEHIFTACNGGSLRCLDSELACSLEHFQNPNAASPILWSIENAHNAGINKLYQLPYSSPCGPALVTGDDIGTVRLWDTRMCGGGSDNKNTNPFDNLMKAPTGCIQTWKVNHDYITDFETNDDGTTLFASSGDGHLSVFDMRFVNRKGTPRSVILPDIDPHKPAVRHVPNNKKSSWDTQGYTQSDNQEDELLSLTLLKKSTKLLCGTQQGILSLFSYNEWGDISDRFPGHPQSIDALLKIDEDTVLTGSSDGLVRAVQLLPNSLLGVLGGHDGFPVEGLEWSAGRKLVGSMSHDEYIRLWDASFLNEDGDSDDEGDESKMQDDLPSKSKQGLGGVSTKAKAGDDSGDDWADMDEDDEDLDDMDSDDSDSDDSGDGGGGKPKKRENIFKSENEEFFSDL